MCLTKESRSCLPSVRMQVETVPWRQGNTCVASMSCSSPLRLTRMPLRRIWNVPSCCVDKSAFNYYKDLAEKGYYNRAISGNVNQRIEVDSIHCNFNTYPYTVTTYAREFIVRQSNVTERSLVTTCTLQNSVRSDNNPQGFLMENFLVKENRDIQTYKR